MQINSNAATCHVHGYRDSEGIIQLNTEDIARGLGGTKAECLRGYPEFVPESTFYDLTANDHRAWRAHVRVGHGLKGAS